MRHYVVDPDNEERLLKVPHRVVADIENRAREDERSNNFTPDDHSDGMTKAYQRGLDAAREAVAVLPDLADAGFTYIGLIHRALAISAIDELKEKQ